MIPVAGFIFFSKDSQANAAMPRSSSTLENISYINIWALKCLFMLSKAPSTCTRVSLHVLRDSVSGQVAFVCHAVAGVDLAIPCMHRPTRVWVSFETRRSK